jgi:deazaflavin-dependent oxidoreductase (nitroreductase family)
MLAPVQKDRPLPAPGLLRFFTRVHVALYRRSRGRIGGRVRGLPVLLLTTIGRKSGARRTVALCFVRDGADWIVIGSVGGAPRHPLWFLNLQQSPEAEIEVGAERHRVRAVPAEGEEHERLWKAVLADAPFYGEYQERTTRTIPVVRLVASGA